jgi:hypothetical protein
MATVGIELVVGIVVRCIPGILLAASIAMPVAAQVPEFSDTLRGETFVARSERFASTHVTSLSTDYHFGLDQLSGLVRSHLLSSTTLLGTPATKDQVDLLVDVDFLLPGALRLFTLTEGTLTNDVRGASTIVPGLNNTAALFTGVGTRISDEDSNRIGIAVGGAYNRLPEVVSMARWSADPSSATTTSVSMRVHAGSTSLRDTTAMPISTYRWSGSFLRAAGEISRSVMI